MQSRAAWLPTIIILYTGYQIIRQGMRIYRRFEMNHGSNVRFDDLLSGPFAPGGAFNGTPAPRNHDGPVTYQKGSSGSMSPRYRGRDTEV